MSDLSLATGEQIAVLLQAAQAKLFMTPEPLVNRDLWQKLEKQKLEKGWWYVTTGRATTYP